ncbi:MAG TPA: hypothetical protein VKA46_36375 [Gemmataceae bacterium]|nr:hypothetical protein [Gemmataceae bacterium]
MLLPELITRIRRAPKSAPCPTCGRRGHRQRILHRFLRDRLNVEQTKAAMQRDFLVALSDGFVYDCPRW